MSTFASNSIMHEAYKRCKMAPKTHLYSAVCVHAIALVANVTPHVRLEREAWHHLLAGKVQFVPKRT